MSYMMKKSRVLQALEEIGLRQIFEITNETSNGVLIQCEQTMGNGKCVISLELNDRPFSCIYYSLGKLTNLGKKDNMIELFNSFNEDNVLLKFYLDSNNCIMAMVTYIATEDEFNGDSYSSLIVPAFKSIEDNYYSKIMRVMWS
ncbi:hypothetical protein HF520_00525 [Romboutsia sp. CE17]|uniref:hypothetical protein n=1 Tax=Romboutsia sp. CE17 TaxID=2724150 RepID=UPI001442ACC8|nr:hypothetical protein [Romboutsia sp. CE17]QJA07522.1 hypothetical protein HF520_00525 [Romboutsia sp. CE17]